MAGWKRIPCKITELRLDKTLVCGQSFRWQETGGGVWIGVMGGYTWKFQQTDTELLYQVLIPQIVDATTECKQDVKPDISDGIGKTKCKHTNKSKSQKQMITKTETGCSKKETFSDNCKDNFEEILCDYFRLDVNLSNLYNAWSIADSNFKSKAIEFMGVRILRQDPVENLFSFICSSNNHISRISGMVEKLCQTYGTLLVEHEGQPYYRFPAVHSLAAGGVEERLRQLGFGYRAKYIQQTALYILDNHSEDWLYSLRDKPYIEAKTELMKLCGVGAKVADCVCLMSLDKLEAVPVDTHVWQIAARDYMPQLKQAKSLTDKLYAQIGDHFRTLWGDQAGWAHSVLFTADLRQFKQTKTDKTKPATKRSKSKEDDTQIKKAK